MAGSKARVPPRWFVVTAWHVHRWIVRASGRRKGLWPPRPDKWGALRLTTRGRHSGEPRRVIVGYFEDGINLVSIAMNGWGAAEPAWWLNLQAHPEAVVELAGGIRREVLGGRRRARSVNGCGTVGAKSTRTWTATPRDARVRRRSSSSSRARRPDEWGRPTQLLTRSRWRPGKRPRDDPSSGGAGSLLEAKMTSIPSLVPRDRYAALERCTYLNQASLGLIPVPAIDAMDTFLKQTAQFGNLYLSDEQEAAILDGVRSAGAQVLGTSPDAVAVVAGASEGLGQATSLLEPEQGRSSSSDRTSRA